MTYIAEERIYVGRYCSIAEDVFVATSGEHVTELVTTWPVENFLNQQPNPSRSYKVKKSTRIGSDVWICRSAQIFGGCTVGDGAVIGAGAMVCRDVPPYAVVVGNPAKIVRYRFPASVCEALLAIAWWNWTPQQIRERSEWFYEPVQKFVAEFGSLTPQKDDAVTERTDSAYREEAWLAVLDAIAASLRWRGLNHQSFETRVSAEIGKRRNDPAASIRREVFEKAARKVLGGDKATTMLRYPSSLSVKL